MAKVFGSGVVGEIVWPWKQCAEAGPASFGAALSLASRDSFRAIGLFGGNFPTTPPSCRKPKGGECDSGSQAPQPCDLSRVGTAQGTVSTRETVQGSGSLVSGGAGASRRVRFRRNCNISPIEGRMILPSRHTEISPSRQTNRSSGS